ncbi:LysE family translocator [Thalassospira mesophila]|uniref:LysE family transporter n=1 Tax=Thalassospira mesophila TaxID=1293891 RepID=A0A1Y2KY94_9PROT|nr:LysE family translocator [Thalassospira mesophila]OSQ35967.1 LysE family transporter [Thalassospira mesophila]
MDIATIFSLALYAFVMSITPGPNNVMLTSSGLLFGIRRTVPHILGIPFGVTLQLCLTGAGLGAVFAVEPRLQLVLKICGTFYLLWLAVKLWRAGELKEPGAARPISFLQAAAFQFINPKAWLIAITVIATFISPGDHYWLQIALGCLVFTITGVPSMAVWAIFGSALKSILHDRKKLRLINRTMAGIAALTAALFWA